MKRIIALAFLVAATFITTRNAVAQNHVVEANVPFSFIVNDTFLPAGKYTIASDMTDPITLVIRDKAHYVRAIDLGMNDPAGAGKPGALVFHHYGNQYFLSEVRFASTAQAVRFSATKQEQKAKKRNHKESVASVSLS